MLLAQCNNTPLCKTCKINTNGTNERPAKQTPTAQTKGFKGKEMALKNILGRAAKVFIN
jgi:hypothetical protein